MSATRFESRRSFLRWLALTSASLPFLSSTRLLGAGADSVPARPWLVGGTGLIRSAYPEDALFQTASQCAVSLTRSRTEGPCYLGVAGREDISEGVEGLPMMLCLQVVNQDCRPLPGHVVEVWHSDPDGLYSGDEAGSDDARRFAVRTCTRGDSAATRSTWFRGELIANDQGRVNFRSCFPGWYPGRTIHVHFRVRREPRGADFVVSQFHFGDELCDQVCTRHPLYADRGVQDTPLGSDGVFRSGGKDLKLDLEQNGDGSLLAYKRIVVQT